MGELKHLPLAQWPAADHAAFARAYAPGDVFDDTAGPGAHLTPGTRRMIEFAWRRWLGFLNERHPEDLGIPPAERITPMRVREFIEQNAREVRSSTVAIAVDTLHHAARLIAPDADWAWLKAISARLRARAEPQDRFHLLVPPWQLVNHGFELMDGAEDLPRARKARELQYRDGLILTLLTFWPIRRRSMAALTVSRHVVFDTGGIRLVLFAKDTKSKRAESFRVPDELMPYVTRYLDEIRPVLVGNLPHDGFWASNKGCPLSGGRIYDIVRHRTGEAFGKPMALHDFRRAAPTFIATEAPELIGLIPGVLQHVSSELSERHYNLARSSEASRRHGATIDQIRSELTPCSPRRKD